MLYEYALEPALLSNWKDFRYFTEKFGFSEGRLISRFPKGWKTAVHTLLSKCDVHECSEMELKRVESLLFEKDSDGLPFFDDRMLPRRHEWNPEEKVWLKNAEAEHGERPFRAILAKDNPRGRNYVLLGDKVEKDTPLFRIEEAPSTPRSAQKMANLVGPVLQIAKEILLIDPHFGPENKRHRDMASALLAAAVRERTTPLPCVEIHTSGKADAKFFSENARKHLPHLIPEGMKVRLVRWAVRDPHDRFHNRFILTDRGGLKFGDGLDNKGGGKDQVSRFGKGSDTYCEQRQLCTKDDSIRTFVDEVKIVGTAVSPKRR